VTFSPQVCGEGAKILVTKRHCRFKGLLFNTLFFVEKAVKKR
jgi:hypothetical protein